MKKIFTFLMALCTTSRLLAQLTTNVQTPCTTTGQNTIGSFTISCTIGEIPLIQNW
jgi:hypothetical protein